MLTKRICCQNFVEPFAQAAGFKACEIGPLQGPGLRQVTGLFTTTAAGGAGG